MTPQGFGKGQWDPPRRKACFGSGSLDHFQRNCPKMMAAVEETGLGNVRVAEDDVIIIGNVDAEVQEKI